MPGWDVHGFVDRTWFGKVYWRVHRMMDWPYVYLGRYHRALFHDPLSAYIIGQSQYPGDQNAVWSAYFHILFDEICSSEPEYKRFLEDMAELDKETRRRTRRKPRVKVARDPFLNFMRKLVELKRMHRAFYIGEYYPRVALPRSPRPRRFTASKRRRKRRKKKKKEKGYDLKI